MIIEENVSLCLKWVLSCREKVKINALEKLYHEFNDIVLQCNVMLAGSEVTTMHNYETIDDVQYIDFEIMIEIDRKIDIHKTINNKAIQFLEEFKLDNAIMFRCPLDLNKENSTKMLNEMQNYINENHLKQKSMPYNVVSKNNYLNVGTDVCDFIDKYVDIYIQVE